MNQFVLLVRNREDGTFNIEYDDGDIEYKVPVTRMKVFITVRSSSNFFLFHKLILFFISEFYPQLN